MSVTVNVNGQSAVGVTAGTGDTINVLVDSVADMVAVTLSPNGGPGPTGAQGPQGQPATTIEIGTVTTGAAGSSASITATTSKSGNLVTLDFTIPQGATGPANSLKIGTVTTGAAGSSAAATITGTAPSQVLNLTIPAGASGGGGGGSVTSVAGRTGAVTLSASDISGLATIATTGSASSLVTGTVPALRLPAATTGSIGAVRIGSGLTISSGLLSTSGASISWVSPPATPTSTGSVGQFAQSSTYLYACYATNTWLRVARASWLPAPTITSVIGDASGAVVDGEITGVSVTVEWSAPSSPAEPITGYLVQINSETAISVAANILTYTFSGLTQPASSCAEWTVSVRAVSAAGQGPAATDVIVLPETTTPVIWDVAKNPNSGAPGVEYTIRYRHPCDGQNWTQFDLEYRYYYNGSEVVVSGDEDGWESLYSGEGAIYVTTTSSTSSQQYQFRVRSRVVSGGSTTATSAWSAVVTS